MFGDVVPCLFPIGNPFTPSPHNSTASQPRSPISSLRSKPGEDRIAVYLLLALQGGNRAGSPPRRTETES